jgi:UDP-glucuronate 4-epimerase
MRILVTGAAGFIGSHLCEKLVVRGHHVVGVDCFDNYLYSAQAKRENARQLAITLSSTHYTLHDADVCDAQAMSALITEEIDVVCHLAALAGVRPSLAEPLRYVRANLHGLDVILERMRAARRNRLVFASSSSVYGSRGSSAVSLDRVQAFREDDPCLTPASVYAATKRAGELLCSTYRDLFDIGTSALRFFTVYGPRQRPDMAIYKFVDGLAQGRPITVYGDGGTRRDYTFIEDIVAGTVAACERVAAGTYKIYNLGGTKTTSLADLISLCERVVGRSAQINRQPLQPGDVPVTYADITNSSRDLDYRPTTDLEQGIAAFWEWYRARKSVQEPTS